MKNKIIEEKLIKVKKRFYFIFFVNFLWISAIFCQEMPFEEKTKYEKALSQKVEDVIVKVLGPNQAKVIVETEMDFTKTEKVIYEKPEKKDFLAEGAGDVSGIEYLMPGFGLPVGKEENKSYSKQLIFPSAFVKKMKVTLLVNKSLKESLIVNIKDITSEVLNLNEKRGDEIIIVRSEFAPLWKNMWYNQESMNFIVKYIILSILGIISLIIVAIGFLKLAGAMNTMAKVQQSHQITMELGGGNFGTSFAPPDMKFLGITPKEEKKETPIQEGEKIYFNVKPYQIDALLNLMIKENPANVAIVVNYLSDNIKEEFLKKLPKDFAAEVIAGLSNIRFLEQDAIMTLKEELETRLAGAIGGFNDVIKSIERLSYFEKSEILKNMENKYPQLVQDIRNSIILLDDIYMLEENELSILISSTSIEDWAIFYSKMRGDFREKLKTQFSQTAWKIIEEKNKYEKPSDEIVESSISNIIKTLEKLIKEGRIKKPLYTLLPEQIQGNRASERLGVKPLLEEENKT